MLTIYEQIQRAVEFVETDLSAGVSAPTAARHACMSLRSFHRYFPALTGYRFGEYVRRRRLTEAAVVLRRAEVSILTVALDSGYDSHEAFSRAFKDEFGVAPSEFRAGDMPALKVRALDLVGEVHMGVLQKSLPDMRVAVFDGFAPDPEMSALRKMEAWLERHGEEIGPHRVFGHNIDEDGRLAFGPEYAGYRVMVTIPKVALSFEDGTRASTIEAGTFAVTGVEGSFEEDPSGSWVTAGWQRLVEMMDHNGIEAHASHRWFEEMLEPVEPGNTRFDLYCELSEALSV